MPFKASTVCINSNNSYAGTSKKIFHESNQLRDKIDYMTSSDYLIYIQCIAAEQNRDIEGNHLYKRNKAYLTDKYCE